MNNVTLGNSNLSHTMAGICIYRTKVPIVTRWCYLCELLCIGNIKAVLTTLSIGYLNLIVLFPSTGGGLCPNEVHSEVTVLEADKPQTFRILISSNANLLLTRIN